MAHGATTAFIAGDWTCVTRLGCALLQNAFQRSDEVKYPTTDPVLQDLYHAIHMLGVVLGLGFSDSGWGLSIEARSVMSMLPNKGANRPKKRARSFL